VKTLKTSVLGTLNMLGLAKRVKARFLLTSTSEVYGDPLQHPQTEEYWGNVNPIGERSCYDEGKRVAETCARPLLTNCTALSLITSLNGNTVRSFPTHGQQSAAQGSPTTVSA
jgi:nucleoside-diphosphate-sugar epimerase